MCSIGSLFLSYPKALGHGISMFERLQKAILASSPNPAHLHAIQASVIGQTFGLLMGWARKVRLFVFDEDPPGNIENLQDDSDALRLMWKSWARLEEKKRIVLALHIHDTELAKLHHHEPILRHAPENLPHLSAPELFAAPCPKSWKALFLTTKQPVQGTHLPVGRSSLLREFPQNDFLSYAMLESIGALAYEERSSGHSGRAVGQQCEEFLIEWYWKYAQVSNASKHPDHFCLMILWHSIFMHLDTGFDQLECACGREGEAATQRNRPYASNWANSRAATRTLLHATFIQQHFQLLPIGAETAIHVPMALYNCGLAWVCFTRFGSGIGDSFFDLATLSEFPEIKLFGPRQLKSFLDIRSNIQGQKSEFGTLFKIMDLLGRIGHWKVAGSFATTLRALVDTQDLF
ncbi:fungal-specific transcription factor domain-containing protein [Penicillium waksmanii]|uniref:fungal-specific transcription factor domain-containing protein n=1 Tax=Penicillium waksmanii TaxID=69791 RepID=UPI002547BA91|nr:fungal-specific transcription factor domain-containing protein [Penicillium waksmanii]KAJ5974812.1 fungal-specific transcription factor domain-containing protein [Penicillium waksmanii]